MLTLYCIFGLGQKFDFRKLSTLSISCFLIELTLLSQSVYSFQIVESSLEMYRVKEKFSDNPDNNILALFNNLSQVRIATSKIILDI